VTTTPATLDALHAKLDALIERTGPPKRFLSIKSAATYADLSQDSIRRMIEQRDLTAHRPVRGKVLVDRLELDRVILGSTARPVNGRGGRREVSSA